jgi:predicted dehydrogenase
MSGQKIKAGVIGAGFIGRSHMSAYAKHPGAELVAVADLDGGRAKKSADEFGAKRIFTDYREMLELPELGAVSVCLPNCLHAPVSIEALEAGKHVLCEKPFAIDAEAAAAMVRTSEKTGRRLAVSLNLRHSGKAQMLKKAADSGALGRIYHGKGGMLRDDAIPRGWFHRKEFSGGGPLLDLGPHILDVIWWIMGKPKPVAASGATYAEFGPRGLGMGTWGVGYEEGPFDVEDFAIGMIRFEGGETLLVEASWAIKVKPVTYSYVCGTEAGATLHPDLQVMKADSSPLELDPMPDLDPTSRFVDDLLAGTPFLAPAEDGLAVMKMLDAIYESASRNQEVSIS